MTPEIQNYLSNQVLPDLRLTAKLKIYAFLPDWKQSNCNARMNELNMIHFSRAWTDEEQTEVAGYQALWDRAKAIREASNVHEANLTAIANTEGATLADILAYDYTTGWPE